MARLLLSVSLAAGICVSPTVCALDVSQLQNDVEGSRVIKLEGLISKGDYPKIRAVVLSSSTYVWLVIVKSPGGDVMEAMRIGRLFRTLSVKVEALECSSACALIWFGSVDRSGGRIALHRPFFDKTYFAGLSKAQAEAKYEELLSQVEKYMTNMGVPREVIERTFQTPSSGVFVLDSNLPMYFRAMARAASYDEWLFSKCGQTPAEGEEMDRILHMQSSLPKAAQDSIVEKFGKYNGCIGTANAQAFAEGWRSVQKNKKGE